MEHSVADNVDCHLRKKYGSCERLPFYREIGQSRYCVLHFPAKDKETDFKKALDGKIEREDFNFAGVYFPSDFPSIAPTTLKAAHFHEAIIDGIAHFSWATFEGWTNFTETTFKGKAEFEGTRFEEGVNFYGATFEKGVDFTWATFNQEAKFYGLKTFRSSPPAEVEFRDAHIEKPELLSFHTVLLRPSWLIDVGGLQKVNFTEVQWHGLSKGPESGLEGEIDNVRELLKKKQEEGTQASRYGLLAKTCRELYINADNNRDYQTANEFHYWSMEALRKKGWEPLGLVGRLYGWMSGYGERPGLAFLVLAVIWAIFSILYALFGPYTLTVLGSSGPLDFVYQAWEAAVYSLGALARLNPEPKPQPGWFQLMVTVEGLLGPLQIALFLLAVRRKVMR